MPTENKTTVDFLVILCSPQAFDRLIRLPKVQCLTQPVDADEYNLMLEDGEEARLLKFKSGINSSKIEKRLANLVSQGYLTRYVEL